MFLFFHSIPNPRLSVRRAGRAPALRDVGKGVFSPGHAAAVEAATAGADIVMLDNFTPSSLKAAARSLKAAHPSVLVEASGGITLKTMAQYLSEDVDVVSQGALTQGYACVDFSLKLPKPAGATCNV